ncbi:hypothetical protein K1719_043917 [Acacia pycnantha]|nr:hypothetical protein K1719_043917 [Acacia pycnantha]
MKHRTWPSRSGASRFSSLPFSNKGNYDVSTKDSTSTTPFKSSAYSGSCIRLCSRASSDSTPSGSSSRDADFSALPYDILAKIAASFTLPNLQAASLVCRSWSEALKPLREAMLLLSWGKRFKHGKRSVRPNIDKALDSFLKAAARGSALAMVDAGLIYWQMGEKEKAIVLYQRAAELGDPAGQCNLGIAYLQGIQSIPFQDITSLGSRYEVGGNARAQYQLALCLHRGHKVNCNIKEAAKWYFKAAEGGYVRAMYNISLCYSSGGRFDT